MGWILSAFFIVYYVIARDVQLLIVSALFAMTGSISYVAVQIEKCWKVMAVKKENVAVDSIELYGNKE